MSSDGRVARRGGIGGRVFWAYNLTMTVVSSSVVRSPIDDLLARSSGSVCFNWSAARLAEAALQRNEGTLADNGALVVKTGAFTGRSPLDKYVVRDATTEGDVWWGSVNHPVSPAVFDQLLDKALAHLAQAAAVRLRRLRRRGGVGAARPARDHREGVARAVRDHAVYPPRLRGPRAPQRPRAPPRRLHADQRRFAARGRRGAGVAVGRLRRDRLHPAYRADPGHRVRRRDEEGDLLGDELPLAAQGDPHHALLGQRRRRRRCATRPSFSGCPAPARPRCRPIRRAR